MAETQTLKSYPYLAQFVAQNLTNKPVKFSSLSDLLLAFLAEVDSQKKSGNAFSVLFLKNFGHDGLNLISQLQKLATECSDTTRPYAFRTFMTTLSRLEMRHDTEQGDVPFDIAFEVSFKEQSVRLGEASVTLLVKAIRFAVSQLCGRLFHFKPRDEWRCENATYKFEGRTLSNEEFLNFCEILVKTHDWLACNLARDLSEVRNALSACYDAQRHVSNNLKVEKRNEKVKEVEALPADNVSRSHVPKEVKSVVVPPAPKASPWSKPKRVTVAENVSEKVDEPEQQEWQTREKRPPTKFVLDADGKKIKLFWNEKVQDYTLPPRKPQNA
uniref:Uncharacterized protein n=1 Tax=viral metagenome TaxID=1070528 RepID=A0A6C0E9Y4_9ZZZZ